MIKIINNLFNKISRRSKDNCGMSLVEVIIAFLIIAIISTVLVRGTITAVNTVRTNKSKTVALAIANEKMEIIKSLDYSNISITATDPGWTINYPELEEEPYEVAYEVTWADNVIDGYKQVKVSVQGGYMHYPVDVVTRLFPPVGEEATGGNVFPPPRDLKVTSDTGEGPLRQVILGWEIPVADKIILRFNVYRDSALIGTALTGYYPDSPGDDNVHSYNVSAVYEGDIESVPSNPAATGTPVPYPPPQNFVITYTYVGTTRIANLAWEPPETELVIVGYIVYRDDIELGTVTDPSASITIGPAVYTFYITTLYEDDNESSPSNSQTTD